MDARRNDSAVYGTYDAARLLGRAPSWIRLQELLGRTTRAVPLGDGTRRLFSRGDLEQLARQAGIDLPDRTIAYQATSRTAQSGRRTARSRKGQEVTV
jgi:hypothetical protein